MEELDMYAISIADSIAQLPAEHIDMLSCHSEAPSSILMQWNFPDA